MAVNEQPITRSELREELRHYATKADLYKLVWQQNGLLIAMLSIAVAVLKFWD